MTKNPMTVNENTSIRMYSENSAWGNPVPANFNRFNFSNEHHQMPEVGFTQQNSTFTFIFET